MPRHPKTPPGPSVFVSYTHADHDHPLLRRLIDDLVGIVDLWIDAQKIRTGGPIASLIDDAIQKSDYFLYVVSGGTTLSNWATSELHLAYASQVRKQNVKIIPIRIDAVPMPALIEDIQVVDLVSSYDAGFANLVKLLAPAPGSRLAEFAIDRSDGSGPIIDTTSAINRTLIDHFARHPEDLKSIDRRRFEELVAELFTGFGYAVELTAKTRDGGRDVIAVGGTGVQNRYLIECKRPDVGKAVGIRPVRELFGVKADEGATKAILATTAYFSKDALLFFERHRWELEARDFDGLMEWIRHYLSRSQAG